MYFSSGSNDMIGLDWILWKYPSSALLFAEHNDLVFGPCHSLISLMKILYKVFLSFLPFTGAENYQGFGLWDRSWGISEIWEIWFVSKFEWTECILPTDDMLLILNRNCRMLKASSPYQRCDSANIITHSKTRASFSGRSWRSGSLESQRPLCLEGGDGECFELILNEDGVGSVAELPVQVLCVHHLKHRACLFCF